MKQRPLIALVLVLLMVCSPLLSGSAWAEEPILIALVDSGISPKSIAPELIAQGHNYVFPDKNTDDRIGHGTAVAGLIVGSYVLELPAMCVGVSLLPLTLCDRYPSGVAKRGSAEDMATAIYDAVDRFGCRIINLSAGIRDDYEPLRRAVEYAEAQGVVVVAAAGNDNLTSPRRVYYPAAYETVIGVGAADGLETADFSQRTAVSVLAQGVGLVTAGSDSVVTVEGSSYACALVSGLCAMLIEADHDASPAQIRERLFASAVDTGQAGFDADSGWGVVSAEGLFRQPLPFSDVAADAWYWDGVDFVYQNGLMLGVSQRQFAPWRSVTRGQLVTVLHRVAGCPEAGAAADFSDVAEGDYFAAAAAWAQESGIARGYGDGSFGPQDVLTAEQAITMLHRYTLLAGTDAPEAVGEGPVMLAPVSGWASQAVDELGALGLLYIYQKDGLDPAAAVERGYLACLIKGLCLLPAYA